MYQGDLRPWERWCESRGVALVGQVTTHPRGGLPALPDRPQALRTDRPQPRRRRQGRFSSSPSNRATSPASACTAGRFPNSKDLVNWTILGHAVSDLTQIGPDLNWDRMNRYGRGVWAGSIRYHAGKFWIYFNTPDEGFFMTTATNPAGPWEPLHLPVAHERLGRRVPVLGRRRPGLPRHHPLRRRLQNPPLQADRRRQEPLDGLGPGHPPVARQRGQQALQDQRPVLPLLQRGAGRRAAS